MSEQDITSSPDLVPARMLNEFVYCPRLFYLEWVQGEWAENRYTEEGKFVHRRADKESGTVPAPEEEVPFKARSVALSAPEAGITTKVDILEGDGENVVPVEYKRGSPAPVPERIYEPERIQVCAQAIALRENGYRAEKGIVYFAETRERVELPIDEQLVSRTHDLIGQLRKCAETGIIPPPLIDSPKCGGCSLNLICLPDEIHNLQEISERESKDLEKEDEASEEDPGRTQLRRLHPARDDALPLYVQEYGGRLGISGDLIMVKDRKGGKLAEARIRDTSQVILLGNIQVTTPAVLRLCEEGIPVSFYSYGGWFHGRLEGNRHKNIEVRRKQFRAADSKTWCLSFSRRLIIIMSKQKGPTLILQKGPTHIKKINKN